MSEQKQIDLANNQEYQKALDEVTNGIISQGQHQLLTAFALGKLTGSLVTKYGEGVIRRLSDDLQKRVGRSISLSTLYRMRLISMTWDEETLKKFAAVGGTFRGIYFLSISRVPEPIRRKMMARILARELDCADLKEALDAVLPKPDAAALPEPGDPGSEHGDDDDATVIHPADTDGEEIEDDEEPPSKSASNEPKPPRACSDRLVRVKSVVDSTVESVVEDVDALINSYDGMEPAARKKAKSSLQQCAASLEKLRAAAEKAMQLVQQAMVS
jgi:hypothetical protein